jgi:glutaredoxin
MLNPECRVRNIREGLLLLALLVLVPSPLPAFAGESDLLRRDPTRAYGAIDVILYETSWCPYCIKARELLKDMGVSLVEYDVEKDRARQVEMIKKSGGSRGVPVIDVEGIIIRGYDPDEIKTVIETQRRK